MQPLIHKYSHITLVTGEFLVGIFIVNRVSMTGYRRIIKTDLLFLVVLTLRTLAVWWGKGRRFIFGVSLVCTLGSIGTTVSTGLYVKHLQRACSFIAYVIQACTNIGLQ